MVGFLRGLLLVLMLLARLLPFLIVAALLIFLWRRSVRKRRGRTFRGRYIRGLQGGRRG